ncbi:S41 family peptidase [Luteimonas saliphila]|uniref:S41 family peptidase n=1 Tax=Luteimonas saliphila TaxID=2804919 RepID=UPI001EE35E43|nr:S41 family peptidase [Luteimonas saliphila]
MPVRKSPLLAVLLPLALACPPAFAQDAPQQEQGEPQAQPVPPVAPQRSGERQGPPVQEDQVPQSPVEDPAPDESPPPDEDEPSPPAQAPAPGDEADPVDASDDPDAAESAATKVPLEEIRRYVGLFNAIRLGYVDPVEDRKLMNAAIRGLLFDLDPHSSYLEKRAAQAFDEGTTGAYDGIGVEVLQLPDGKVRVIAPIDDTPAAKAGIRSGDTIVAVDGKPLTPADAEGHGPLRGPPGTQAVLTVLREGEAKPLEITVHRETIRVASVRGRMLEPGYGYVRISQFQVETGDDFARTVQRLRGEAGGALKGLVIDVRSNPGGLLTSAVRVADDLLDKGRIVSTRGRNPVNDTEFSATPGDLMDGAPVVVIIDAGSASASEVLAGALHDNGRARIVGSRSFGKGSVQTVMPLGNGDAVKLTTARYYTPSGRSIQARGIDPDIVLKPDDSAPELVSTTPGYAEATLPGHLRGDEEEEGTTAGDVLDGDGPIDAALAELKKPTPGVAAAPAPTRE